MVLPTTMVLFSMLPSKEFNALIYVLGGLMVGSLLPDIDASDSKIMYGSWKGIGLFGKYLFYKPMTWILRRRSEAFQDEHRGYLHSLIGCLLATLFFALPIGVIFILTAYVWLVPFGLSVLIWYAWLGLPIGFLMHLVEDSFTKSGVRWFFPRGKAYSGRTSTGKKSEYNLLTAFLITFGILTVGAWMIAPSPMILLTVVLLSVVLVGVLFAANRFISKI
jgi:membrane-bound metal-dependent hydrolase YbcI (DUF457 family)